MIVICPNCWADETSFFDPAGENFCSECGASLDDDGGGQRIVIPPMLPDQIEYLEMIKAAGGHDPTVVIGGPRTKL